ncbi:MAG: PilN domain-containing protein [Janthinobacterium lividum]
MDAAQHDGLARLVGLGNADQLSGRCGGRALKISTVKISQATQSPVHLEWTSGGVRAVNIVTHEKAEAAHLSDLGTILSGQATVLVGIGRRDVFMKTMRLPKADSDDLRRILSVQLGQLFPLPPDQLAFDFFQTADLTAEGCLTVVAAMRSEDLKKLQSELKTAGLTASRILPISLAAPAVAASAGQEDALVIESGLSGFALDVVRGGTIVFSRVVPGASDIGCEATRTLAAAGAKALPIVSVGTVNLPDTMPGLGSTLSLLHGSPPFSFRLAEDRVRDTKKRAGDRTRLAVLLMLSAFLLVALVAADREAAQASVKRRQGVLARQLTRLQSIQDTEAAEAQKVSAVQDVLDRAFVPAQPLGDIVGVVGDSLPPGSWLSGLGVERGKPLQIRGTTTTAADVPRIVHTLGANTRFRDVHLVFANSVTIGKARMVEFDVSAVCVGNLPLSEPDKTDGGSSVHTESQPTGGAE